MRQSYRVLTGLACAAAIELHAAPLDALLTALQPTPTRQWALEVGADQANRSLDVLGLRPKRADGSYGPSGDYNGGHLRLGLALTPTLRLEGGLWKRSIQYVSASADVTSWQLAGQWQFLTSASGDSAAALRAGAWGNQAPLLRRTSSAVVQGTTFTSAQATNPRDRQVQLDLVASWRPLASVTASAFAGVGHSKVDFDQISATTGDKDSCNYQVSFVGGNVIAQCESNGSAIRISTPAAVYGINVDQEARYNATSLQVGANLDWQYHDWSVRAGAQYVRLDRGAVDEIVLQRGGKSFPSTSILVLDVGCRVMPRTQLFVRGQVMAHQFVGEAPLMYNTLTATQHRRRYGIATFGVSHSF